MEMWKDVVGYEGSYEVSDSGNVRSIDRHICCNTGLRTISGQSIKPKIVKGGYAVVQLSLKRQSKMKCVHTLVMEAFVGPRPLGQDICHNDGSPANNQLTNLRYDTRKNNHSDKRLHGTMAKGSSINTSRLTEIQVLEIRNKRANLRQTVESLAAEYGVSSVAISKICVGDTWKHIGGPLVERMKRTFGGKT